MPPMRYFTWRRARSLSSGQELIQSGEGAGQVGAVGVEVTAVQGAPLAGTHSDVDQVASVVQPVGGDADRQVLPDVEAERPAGGAHR